MKRIKAGYIAVRIVAFFVLVVIMGACSTQKNTFVNRSYHTITTKFNGYFNALESYRSGKQRLAEQHVENYEGILSIFKYGTPQQAAAINSYMDVAYQKSSIVIRRHSMNIRGVEYNKHIDDAWFLIARSHFFKRDFNLAILSFEYIVRQYDSPLVYESKVWVAKSQMFQERYSQAQQMLDIVARDIEQGLVGEEGRRMYNLVSADLKMRQGNYKEAIAFLRPAIELTSGRNDRTRLTFILGQIYQQIDDYSNAQATYAQVLKMNPSFNLAFQARIRMAMAYDPASGDSGAIRAELMRMLRDDKNEEYRDQIYYALGQMALRQEREEEAIDLFIESTKVSVANRLQKGLSFYQLGQIYFEKPDYLKASVNYDSTTTFLPQSFEGFEEINRKRVMLAELARNIRVIAREDSLQRLAAMSATERNAIVDEIVAQLREKERLDREAERDRMQTMQTMAQTRRQGGQQQQDAGWYFYNPSSMSFGRTEFVSRFGERPLEDLWRISNKQTMAFGFETGDEWDDEQEEGEEGSQINRSTFMRNIPTTPEMLAESNRKIAQAYYNKGLIFRDRFQDYKRSATSFETLISRFPEFDNKLYAYYFLYNLHRTMGDNARGEVFKNRILTEFPESEFSQILGDPNYLEKVEKRQNMIARLYESTYNAFGQGNYQLVIDNATSADSLELTQDMRSKFAYIKALSFSHLGNQQEFRQELQQVVDYFTGTQVHQPASDLLASLDPIGETPAPIQQEDPGMDPNRREQVSVFAYNEDAVHFFVMVIDVRQVDARELRRVINDFNRDNYSEREFSMSNIFLDEKNQLITLTNFINKEAGMEYYNRFVTSEGLKDFKAEAMQAFIISVDNYPVFYQEKNVEEYSSFFKSRYFRN